MLEVGAVWHWDQCPGSEWKNRGGWREGEKSFLELVLSGLSRMEQPKEGRVDNSDPPSLH